MDGLTASVEIIKAVAWPLTALAIALEYKNQISKLAERLKKLKHKDTEFEFEQGVNEIAKQEGVEVGQTPPMKVAEPVRRQREALFELAEVSPRAAIVEAYRVLEMLAKKAVRSEDKPASPTVSNAFRALLRQEVIDSKTLNQFNDLRMLRNQAVHMEDFNADSASVQLYINLCLSIGVKITNWIEKNKEKL